MDAVILAGGENRRMPAIKGLLEINGKKIIESQVGLFRGLFARTFISTNNPEWFFYLGAPMIGDVLKERGPMTGIFSTLVNPHVTEVFAAACDMPFINALLIKYMIDRWEDKWDAAVPVYDKKPQPLSGIYSKRIAGRMEESIRGGGRSIRDFLKKINVLFIPEDEVRKIDVEGRTFVNINTPEDFRREGG